MDNRTALERLLQLVSDIESSISQICGKQRLEILIALLGPAKQDCMEEQERHRALIQTKSGTSDYLRMRAETAEAALVVARWKGNCSQCGHPVAVPVCDGCYRNAFAARTE